MAAISLLFKDFREHRWAALILGAGCLIVVLALLAQNRVAAYSMSSFEIVRFALLSFLPLIALIVGNRLIVREYLSGTRLFVEALPIGSNLPLVLKYLLGFTYIALISVMMIALAAQQAGIADDVTAKYVTLILGKTLAMVSLYWSMVFCFSLCGYLRIALYLLSGAIIAVIAYYPGLDATRFAPFALMEDDLFVYERDVVPWTDIAGTLLLSFLFTAVGFVLTRLGEGSVIERLAKPMTRRDYVALGVLAAAGLTLWATLLENNQRDPIDFSSEFVVRLNDPEIAVLYLNEKYESSALDIAQRTRESVSALQATLGLQYVPTIRLALSPSREKHDIDYATSDGVFITANWLDHESYDNAVLDSVVIHGLLSAQTNGRAMFEPYHWVLDGFTRWWVEQGLQPLQPTHRAELLSRALLAMDRQKEPIDMIRQWQVLADQHSYPSAEALAWAAFSYVENTQGRDAVIRLAREFLIKPTGSTAMASLRDRVQPVEERFESLLGTSLADFNKGWQDMVEQQRLLTDVQFLLESVPSLAGRVVTLTDEAGVHKLTAYYEPLKESTPKIDGRVDRQGSCILKHDYIGPFDTEYEVTDDYEDVQSCQTETVAHTIDSTYAPGDRVFIALDFESPDFHQPVRLHAERVYIP